MQRKKILMTKFMRDYLHNANIDCYYSSVMKQHFIIVDDVTKFEDGTKLTKSQLMKAPKEEGLLKAYMAVLNVFDDNEVQVVA